MGCEGIASRQLDLGGKDWIHFAKSDREGCPADRGGFVDLGKGGAQTSSTRSYLLFEAQALVLEDMAVHSSNRVRVPI